MITTSEAERLSGFKYSPMYAIIFPVQPGTSRLKASSVSLRMHSKSVLLRESSLVKSSLRISAGLFLFGLPILEINKN